MMLGVSCYSLLVCKYNYCFTHAGFHTGGGGGGGAHSTGGIVLWPAFDTCVYLGFEDVTKEGLRKC